MFHNPSDAYHFFIRKAREFRKIVGAGTSAALGREQFGLERLDVSSSTRFTAERLGPSGGLLEALSRVVYARLQGKICGVDIVSRKPKINWIKNSEVC
jgi:hypothetical protein